MGCHAQVYLSPYLLNRGDRDTRVSTCPYLFFIYILHILHTVGKPILNVSITVTSDANSPYNKCTRVFCMQSLGVENNKL